MPPIYLFPAEKHLIGLLATQFKNMCYTRIDPASLDKDDLVVEFWPIGECNSDPSDGYIGVICYSDDGDFYIAGTTGPRHCFSPDPRQWPSFRRDFSLLRI